MRPPKSSSNIAAAISNDDIDWDGTYIGLMPKLTGATKDAEQRATQEDIEEIAAAIEDEDKCIAAYLLLLDLTRESISVDGGYYGVVRVALHADGKQIYGAGNQARIRKWWASRNVDSDAKNSLPPGILAVISNDDIEWVATSLGVMPELSSVTLSAFESVTPDEIDDVASAIAEEDQCVAAYLLLVWLTGDEIAEGDDFYGEVQLCRRNDGRFDYAPGNLQRIKDWWAGRIPREEQEPAAESPAIISNDDVDWQITDAGLAPTMKGITKEYRAGMTEENTGELAAAIEDDKKCIAAYLLLNELIGDAVAANERSYGVLRLTPPDDFANAVCDPASRGRIMKWWAERKRHPVVSRPVDDEGDRSAQ